MSDKPYVSIYKSIVLNAIEKLVTAEHLQHPKQTAIGFSLMNGNLFQLTVVVKDARGYTLEGVTVDTSNEIPLNEAIEQILAMSEEHFDIGEFVKHSLDCKAHVYQLDDNRSGICVLAVPFDYYCLASISPKNKQ